MWYHKFMKTKMFILFLIFQFFAFPAFAAKPSPIPTPAPLKSICLDPGHGGSDPGAIYFGMNEKDLNLSVGLNLQNRLTADGYTVHMTRTTDTTLSNADRYNYCNSTDATLVISIHQNASTNIAVDYTEVLYAKHTDKTLAAQFSSTIGSLLGLPNTYTNFADGVLIKTTAPAVLTESLFMSSAAETTGLQNGTRLDQEALAIESAIQAHYGN